MVLNSFCFNLCNFQAFRELFKNQINSMDAAFIIQDYKKCIQKKNAFCKLGRTAILFNRHLVSDKIGSFLAPDVDDTFEVGYELYSFISKECSNDPVLRKCFGI